MTHPENSEQMPHTPEELTGSSLLGKYEQAFGEFRKRPMRTPVDTTHILDLERRIQDQGLVVEAQGVRNKVADQNPTESQP
jgi:hypothetical protein